MAGQGAGSKEELLQTAHALSDILKEMKAAAEEGSREWVTMQEGSRGDYGRRGGRGAWGGGTGRGGRGGAGGRGRGGNRRGYRGSPNRGGYDRSRKTWNDMEEAQSETYCHQSNDWKARNSSYGYQDCGREDFRAQRNIQDHLGRSRYQSNYQESGMKEWREQSDRQKQLRGYQESEDSPRCQSGRRQHGQAFKTRWGETREQQVEPHKLVKALSTQPNFSASLLQLMEQHQLTPASVRAAASRYSLIFYLQGETVQLQPQLDICAEHCGPLGCQHRHTCTNLHLCPKMVMATCDADHTCEFGHNWHTNHNLSVLKPLYLDHLRDQTLRELLQMIYAEQEGQHEDAGLLTVCADYNQSVCDKTVCHQLHICLSFVTRLTRCSHKDCQLNHDLLSPSCLPLLKTHGISTNESPRDILLALLQANPNLSQAEKETKDTKPNKEKNKEKALDNKKSESKKHVKDSQEKYRKHRHADDSHEEESLEDTGQDSSEENNDNRDSSSGSQDSASSDEAVKKSRKATSRQNKGNSVSSDNEDSSSDSSVSEFCDEKHKSSDKVKKKNIKNQKLLLGDGEESEKNTTKGVGEVRDFVRRSSNSNRKKTIKKNQQLEDGVESEKNTSEKVTVTGEARDGTPRRTLWAHYLLGNVASPEICYYSVESVCRNEADVCPRLHASHHFHWQVRQQSDHWKNLPHNQVICLERAFCDPELTGVDLPRLDPSSLGMSQTGLVILLGRDTWHADFPNSPIFSGFTLTNSSKMTLELRRLCTEPVPGQPTLPSKNTWYFLDKNNKWVKYGNVDTVGETNLVSSITSDDIEKHFQQTPTVPLSFTNFKFKYTLDLQTMKQTNLNTNVSRAVRRRPEPHLPSEQEEKKDTGQKTSSELPLHWEAMQKEERLRMVTLAPTSSEYQKVVGLLGGRVPTSNLMKVERIQNPFLWIAFQNKVTELTAVYKGDASKVDVRQLFHGTSPDVISSICAENLDWRLHGTASGQSFGRGTYFSTDAKYSYGYARTDPCGLRYMFVVKVAVGTITQGNSSMVRPPTNPATSLPFDSTGNSASNSSIIVKYDKQEYYPEYVLTLT